MSNTDDAEDYWSDWDHRDETDPFRFTVNEELGFKLIDTKYFREISSIDEHRDSTKHFMKKNDITIKDILCTFIHNVKPAALAPFVNMEVEDFNLSIEPRNNPTGGWVDLGRQNIKTISFGYRFPYETDCPWDPEVRYKIKRSGEWKPYGVLLYPCGYDDLRYGREETVEAAYDTAFQYVYDEERLKDGKIWVQIDEYEGEMEDGEYDEYLKNRKDCGVEVEVEERPVVKRRKKAGAKKAVVKKEESDEDNMVKVEDEEIEETGDIDVKMKDDEGVQVKEDDEDDNMLGNADAQEEQLPMIKEEMGPKIKQE